VQARFRGEVHLSNIGRSSNAPSLAGVTLLESLLLTAAPAVGSLIPGDADAGGRTRSSASSGDVAGELDTEVARLLRVRSGELAEPLAWQRPSHRREVDAVVRQLGPIRTRTALLSSWQREGRRSPQIRLGYAVAWLALAGHDPAATTRRARRRPRVAVLRGAG
jgi:hypothetical protein